MIKEGEKAPNFSLISTDGTIIDLANLKGKKVVLYFYPKDETPGCTKEACDFRDSYADIKAKAVLLGISSDDTKSHNKFTEKHKLPFPLLSDTDKSVAQAYGTWGEKSMFGKKYMGMIRATFVIDEAGVIQKVWPKVSVTGHVKAVLKELEK